MFVAHGIPSFYKLLRTSIYRVADRVSKIQKLYYNGMHDSYCLYSLSHSAMVEISVMLISTILLCDILLLLFLLLFLYMFNIFFYMYMDRVSAIKIYYYIIIIIIKMLAYIPDHCSNYIMHCLYKYI